MRQRLFTLTIAVVLAICLHPLRADFVENFDGPKLNEDVWLVKQAGNASYSIEKGVLILDSPDLPSGIMLYLPRDIEKSDIAFEIRLDISGVVDGIYCSTIAKMLEPTVNTDINANWLASIFFQRAGWLVKQDPVVIGQIPPNPFTGPDQNADWNVTKLSYSESKGKVTVDLNGKQVGEVDKNKEVKERYFNISPDHYTSHYTGNVGIDSIKITGPGSAGLAVQARGRLTTTWATLKH